MYYHASEVETQKEKEERFIKWVRGEYGDNIAFTVRIWLSKKYLEYPFDSDIYNLILTRFLFSFFDYEKSIKHFYKFKLRKVERDQFLQKVRRFCDIKLNNMVKEIFEFIKRRWKKTIEQNNKKELK